MSGFSVKRVNVVGAFASLWAFIFAFFPFYRIEPMEVLIQQAGKQAESYALTKIWCHIIFWCIVPYVVYSCIWIIHME